MEILYYYKGDSRKAVSNFDVRWLSADDYDTFCEHLTLCGQRSIDEAKWKRAYADGTVYCGLFADGKMLARACVEKYSVNAWEVADVRTVRQFQNNGYAFQLCSFVLNYILENGRTATIRTEEDNVRMKKVVEKLGFSLL